MTGTSSSTQTGSTGSSPATSYNVDSDLVDFILGITFEIWEQGQVEKINDYYAADVEVFSLEGLTRTAATMVANTYSTLNAYPDRLLIPDDVITWGTTRQGFSSHRLLSPMTNTGETNFGPATGKSIFAMNIADCEVNDGLITREWLVRDNLAMIRQLGFDPLSCARVIKENFNETQAQWLRSEYLRTTEDVAATSPANNTSEAVYELARKTLDACWITGDAETLETAYAPYCVLHRAPTQRHSGRTDTLEHYASWRNAFPNASLTIDHICNQPYDANNQRIAVRWSVAGKHEGDFENAPASGKPIYILGVTHWELVDGRIAVEKTVFDELSVIAQTLD